MSKDDEVNKLALFIDSISDLAQIIVFKIHELQKKLDEIKKALDKDN